MAGPTRLNPSTLPDAEAIGYSQISIVNQGPLAFVSGQVAADRDGGEARKNRDGYQKSVRGFAGVMAKLREFLNGAKPSLTGVGVSALASPDFLLEIEMVVQLESAE